MGANCVGLVSMLTPGSITPVRKDFRLAACLITFSRVRSSPHAFSTCTTVCAAAYPKTFR